MPLTDPSLDLQVAITGVLTANEDIAALIQDRIFDRIPDAPTFPYISFGDTQILPELGENTDAVQSYIILHTWDRFQGFDAVKALGKLIIAALHDVELPLPNQPAQSVLLETSHYLRDPDGLTSHGVLTFSILTDQNLTS